MPTPEEVESLDPSSNTHLKVYTEETPVVVRPEIEAATSFPLFQDAFRRTTGWALELIPEDRMIDRFEELQWSRKIKLTGEETPGYLGLTPIEPNDPSVDHPRNALSRDEAQTLAESFARMFEELLENQRALWQREAELAAGVPLVHAKGGKNHLAVRLETVLQGGVEAVGADAAALYLLDEGTSLLKLRACWGMPRSRLLDPARPLQGSLADLEALLGHAVVLDDPQVMKLWNVPEDFSSAVCVPVSTPTTILGTIWIFSRRKRDFTDTETGMAEVVAGRIASDLEREMLMNEGVQNTKIKEQMAAAQQWQRGGMPSVPPLVNGWEMAGWSRQASSVGGDFYHWFCSPSGRITLALGDASGNGIDAALTASAVKSALRAHTQYHEDPTTILSQLNLTLWTDSAGDREVNLFCGSLGPSQGEIRFASAGEVAVVALRRDGWELLSQPGQPIGISPEAGFQEQIVDLAPGEALVVFSEGVFGARDHLGQPLEEAGLAIPLQETLETASTKDLLALACDRLEAHAADPNQDDRAILILRRTP